MEYIEAEDVIVCRGECGYRYPVRDDIPVMLIDEAEKPCIRIRRGQLTRESRRCSGDRQARFGGRPGRDRTLCRPVPGGVGDRPSGARSAGCCRASSTSCVFGMGGSGVSGDVVQALVEPRLGVPWRTIKSYGPVPEWVGRNTLVFSVSYSGNTEETLAAFEEIHAQGRRPVAVSSGGRLAELAASYGVAHVRIPAGLQPRASLGFLALPAVGDPCGDRPRSRMLR